VPEGADAADHRAARPLGDGGVRELRPATARGTRERLEVELAATGTTPTTSRPSTLTTSVLKMRAGSTPIAGAASSP